MEVLLGGAQLEATTNNAGNFFSIIPHHNNRLTRFTFIQNATNSGSVTLIGSSEEALGQSRGGLFAYVGVGEPGD